MRTASLTVLAALCTSAYLCTRRSTINRRARTKSERVSGHCITVEAESARLNHLRQLPARRVTDEHDLFQFREER